MLRGLSTIRYHAADLDAARLWYTDFLDVEPYFERPGYVEFRIGDHEAELGIMDSRFLGFPSPSSPGGVVMYWHVDDLAATLARAVELGATVHEETRDFGHGFIGAALVDPFGNILGVMQNPHYLEMLERLLSSAEGSLL